MLKIVALLGLVAAVAHCASVATADSKDSQCSITDRFKAMSCLLKMAEFVDKIDELDLDEENDLAEFHKSCKDISSCFASMKCGGEKSEMVVNRLKGYCEAVNFFSAEFIECGNKLEEKKSKCYDEYNPFEYVDESTKPVDPKAPKPICKGLFGKDNCMKKDVSETCGEKDWEGLKKYMAYIANSSEVCTVPPV
ncbi:unnamed protein product [Caenorhabditis bovis]|uniref:T20D4.11-like domain-containing protein n=1 Tax=Caenorhabditis bovis TaxID=2654633 RepID=A0A8S1EBV2_9PELO|nr:unnamed protein product [Caenorhabditis bovis]